MLRVNKPQRTIQTCLFGTNREHSFHKTQAILTSDTENSKGKPFNCVILSRGGQTRLNGDRCWINKLFACSIFVLGKKKAVIILQLYIGKLSSYFSLSGSSNWFYHNSNTWQNASEHKSRGLSLTLFYYTREPLNSKGFWFRFLH